jgi:aminoglycoside 3-N-acetyltransferase
MVTRADIAEGFRALGLNTGDAVLVHSSLKSFGRVDGGADTVIDGVLDALGPDGTLIAPTLTGHENFSPANPPHIDLRTQPCWTGLIPETVRLRPKAVRSTHPTHSCAALGGLADELTRGHHISPTPCGTTSPYFRVAMAGGYIAMVGCTLSSCTTFHTVEEIANVGYHLQQEVAFGTCIDRHGVHVDTPCLLHSYAGPERDFPVLEPLLIEKGLMRVGTIGACTVRLINALGLIEIALDKLRFDPYYLTVKRGAER